MLGFSMLYAYSMNLFTSRTAHRDKFLSDQRKCVLGKKNMRRRVATTDDVLLLLRCFVDSELSQFGEKEKKTYIPHEIFLFLHSGDWCQKDGNRFRFQNAYASITHTPNEHNLVHFFISPFSMIFSFFFTCRLAGSRSQSIFISINAKAIFQLAWTWW